MTKNTSRVSNNSLLVYWNENTGTIWKGLSREVCSLLQRNGDSSHYRNGCWVWTKVYLLLHRRLNDQDIGRNKKETFEILKFAGIACQYFCRRSYATWDILPLPEMLTWINVSTKQFQFKPEFKGTRRIKLTVCIVPLKLNGEAFADYMSASAASKRWKPCASQTGWHTETSSWTSTLIGRASVPPNTV